MESAELRAEIDRLMASDAARAARALSELWRREPAPAAAAFVVSRFETLRAFLPLTPCRVALARSFTLEPVVPLLRAAAFAAGLDLTVHLGDFNAYAQEMLDESSALYRFAPEVVILAVQTRDAAPELWLNHADLTPEACETAIQRVLSQFRDCLRAFRSRSQAHLIVHSLELPLAPARGVLDNQAEPSQSEAIRRVNRELRSLVREFKAAYLLDYDALVARHGRARWHDERKWLTARLPIAAAHLIDLANEWLRFLHPLLGKTAKALVVDLDNTLWGGVIGEDGMEGIQVGPEHPGAAYQALQRAMLDLYRRGILLAICSKNNYDDAMEVLRHHPGMLLREQHFACLRIDWNDKAQNLREIAAELNIGTDALAFFDDNPVERERVRAELPEVAVIELPRDPLEYAQTLRDCPLFERLSLSEEDFQRGGYYAGQRQRTQLEQSLTTREDFYRALDQEAEIAPVAPATLARVAQLTQKTNQFNLTTRRYTEQQIAAMASRSDWRVLSIRVRDRFGDNGLVGVAITHDSGEVCEIDAFLLSCRVIGRTVESAFLAHLAETARARGIRTLQGWFLPTKKNTPARDFYPQHGFQPAAQQGDASLWMLDLSQARLAFPEWIKIIAADGDSR
jgi:FkbH-like protein